MEKGCENCRHKKKSAFEFPCMRCIRNATDKWEPEQDLVEVVRCGKCEFSIPSEYSEHALKCTHWMMECNKNGFCNYGERRSDGKID